MKVSLDTAEFVDSGMRAWYVVHKANNGPREVFTPSLKVTPLSVFAENVWRFPEHYAPPGSRVKCTFNFLGKVSASETLSFNINATGDDLLLMQLKQCTYLFMYHREEAEKSNNPSPLSVSTAHNNFLILRRIFCNMKRAGFKSLRELNSQDAVERVFSSTGCAALSYNVMVKVFTDIASFCQQGYITDGMPDVYFFISLNTIVDHNDDEGAGAFEIEDVAQILDRSLFYIDNSNEIARRVIELRRNEEGFSNTYIWARDNLPCGEYITSLNLLSTLSTLTNISAYNLGGYHLGCRGSEFLSATAGFIGRHSGDGVLFTDRMTLRTTTFKTIRKLYGDVRYFPVHPYMLNVSDALTGMQDALGLSGGPLFASPHTGRVYAVSQLNERIQFFLKINDIDVHATSHTWRKTVPGIIVEVMHTAIPDLVELLGHSSEEETARYAAASPWLQDSIAKESRHRMEVITRTMLSQTRAFGGSGLGGGGALNLEKIAGTAKLNARVGLSDTEIIKEEASEMFETGVVPSMIDQDGFCFKPKFAQGLCTQTSGNLVPDTERCQKNCDHHVQLSQAKESILNDINSLSQYLDSVTEGKLAKMRWCSDLVARLRGFDDLAELLDRVLDENPSISFWFR